MSLTLGREKDWLEGHVDRQLEFGYSKHER